MTKVLAVFTAFLLPASAFAGDAQELRSPNLIVQPELSSRQPEKADEGANGLEAARLAGSVTAGAGVGLLGFALVAEMAGPVGWAAALIFFGGLSAYLAQRRLNGKDALVPERAPEPAPPEPAPGEPSTATQKENPLPGV